MVGVVVDYSPAILAGFLEPEFEAAFGAEEGADGCAGSLSLHIASEPAGCQRGHGVFNVDLYGYAEADVVDASAGIYEIETYLAVAAAYALGVEVARVARIAVDFHSILWTRL